MTDTRLPRWVNASIATHFSTLVNGELFQYTEGEERETEDQHDYFELRLDGPYINEVSKGLYQVDCTINALVCSIKNDENIYTLDDNIGIVLKGFTKAIQVFQLNATTAVDGDGDPLPPIFEGCLVLQTPVGVTRFGQIRSDERLMQAQVEASYRMLIQ